MTESDLARPVVEVKDFETKKLEYEIYTFGEENVIIPVKKSEAEPAVNKLAKKQIYTVVRRFDKNADIEILNGNKAVVRVENKAIPRIIGKKGKTIKELEDHLGISIEVMPKVTTLGEEIDFEYQETGAYLVITFKERMQRRTVNFYVGEDYLFSATVGKNNQVRVAKNSDVGKETLKALLKKNLRAFV
jgi:ATPase